MAKVDMYITIETEERADRWVCRSPELAFTVYGETREEARQEVNKALAALLGSFHQDLEAIDRFLEKRNVKHVIRYDDEPDYRNTVIEMSHEEVLI